MEKKNFDGIMDQLMSENVMPRPEAETAEKKSRETPGRKTARVASKCALVCLCTSLLWFFSGALPSVVVAVLLGFVFAITALVSAVVGTVLGIVALRFLTPEEKQERLWTSGTTKNLAAAGIAMPLLIIAGVFWVKLLAALLSCGGQKHNCWFIVVKNELFQVNYGVYGRLL